MAVVEGARSAEDEQSVPRASHDLRLFRPRPYKGFSEPARGVGSAGGLDGLHGMADWSGDASRRRFEPCMRFSRTRLTDIVHRLAYTVVGRTVPLRRWTRRLFSHS